MVKKVSSKAGEHVSVMKGKEQIGKAFADYLALFDVVYHLKNDCRAQRQHPLCQRRLACARPPVALLQKNYELWD